MLGPTSSRRSSDTRPSEPGRDFGSVRKSLAAQDLVPLDPRLKDREAYLQWFRDMRVQIKRES